MAFPSLKFSCPRASCFDRGNQVVYENNGFKITSVNCCSCICFPFFGKNSNKKHERTRSNFEQVLQTVFEDAARETLKKKGSDSENPLTVIEMEHVITETVDVYKRNEKKHASAIRFYKLFEDPEFVTPVNMESIGLSDHFDFSNVIVQTIDGKSLAFDENRIKEKINDTQFDRPVEESDIINVIRIIKDEIAYRNLQIIESVEIEKLIVIFFKIQNYIMQKPSFIDPVEQRNQLNRKIAELDNSQLTVISEVIKKVI